MELLTSNCFYCPKRVPLNARNLYEPIFQACRSRSILERMSQSSVCNRTALTNRITSQTQILTSEANPGQCTTHTALGERDPHARCQSLRPAKLSQVRLNGASTHNEA